MCRQVAGFVPLGGDMKDHPQIDVNKMLLTKMQSAGHLDVNLSQTAVLSAAGQSANVNAPYSSRMTDDPFDTPGPLPHAWYRAAGKRGFDIAFVIATLPISVVIILGCAVALWLEGGHPFFRQDRLGKGGKVFSILKLRTMVRDADEQLAQYLESDPDLKAEWTRTQKLKNDPRITRTGALLRATSLDELPQLWNVLIGQMSLVGPRPMMPDQLPLYGDQRAYFALQPGITGLWQVSARNEHQFSYRAKIDHQYFHRVSLWQDIGLLFRTVGVVVRKTGY